MHQENLTPWQHAHDFGQDRKRPGEVRTIIVIVITATMMVVEIATGLLCGSMALLADGLHMASHAAVLGGFSGAVLLALFALMMAWESVERILGPVEIAFNQAIFVAVVGLIVNGVSVFILGHQDHDHESDQDARVADLHLWSIGPDIHGLIVFVVASDPKMPAQ
ncbi:MAG: hypothetical protein AUJ92_11520 [Armatimonadetes bacterium CG2_30_59_28]|nr:cation transporter [Armatimonadota bacterium]OIO93830.1 MAG: hypothetical protein AUJ92_11520 [Armatimonadetes bacterium CG2_30_59_28]